VIALLQLRWILISPSATTVLGTRNFHRQMFPAWPPALRHPTQDQLRLLAEECRSQPWRLIRADFLDQLFAFQIKLR